MSEDERLVATGSQTIGPFFHFGLTPKPDGRMVGRVRADGPPITLRITVRDGDGQPVPDAVVELWQSGGFGRMPTDETGSCEFQTLRPASRRGETAGCVNVCLFARGLLRQLHTRIYFAGDDALAGDRVLALVPPERRATLMARPLADAPPTWIFDIHLQGAQETVFFDV